MSDQRKDIYIKDGLRKVLEGRTDSLTSVVNMIAERYTAILARAPRTVATTVREDDVYREVIKRQRDRGRRMESQDIAIFPALVAEFIGEHPEYPMSAVFAVQDMGFCELVALVDRIERRA